MINSPLFGRVFLAVSFIAMSIGSTGCTTHRQQSAEATGSTHKVKTASLRKPAKIAKAQPAKTQPAKAATVVNTSAEIVTASLAPQAPIVGRTWNYEYGGSRGTITYNADGTSSFNEPGLRKGSGKWRMQDGTLCQSFSGIKEPCVSLRQSGKAIYVGGMKLTQAE